MSPGGTRLLAQRPLLAGAPVMAPLVQAFKSEPRPRPDLGVVPSDWVTTPAPRLLLK